MLNFWPAMSSIRDLGICSQNHQPHPTKYVSTSPRRGWPRSRVFQKIFKNREGLVRLLCADESRIESDGFTVGRLSSTQQGLVTHGAVLSKVSNSLK